MMRTNETVRVAIAETSVIIRTGVSLVLKRLPSFRVQPIELVSMEALHDCLRTQYPNVLIVNPAFGGYFDVERFRDKNRDKPIRIIALVSSFVDTSLLNKYDDHISIFDGLDVVSQKLVGLEDSDHASNVEEQDTLSQREKEIVVCVVRGMTNKEMADRLFLSIHTVITHRRNISKKLQIHSAAGLTIYAIVNKLVSLDEVKDL